MCENCEPSFHFDCFDGIPDEILSQLELPSETSSTEISNNQEETKEKQRFVSLSEDDLDQIVNKSEAKSTKQSTKWGVKIFEGKQINFF